MSFECEVTGKKRLKGNRVSHANNKSTHFQRPNIRDKKIFVPELGLNTVLRVSSAGLRTIDKHGGLARFILSTAEAKLSPKLKRLRKLLTSK